MKLFSSRWLLIASFLFTFLGCAEKDVTPSIDTGPHTRLKKSVFTFSLGTSTTTYYYNSSNKVDYYENETRVPSEGRLDRGTLTCFYNAQNQLSKTEFRYGTEINRTVYTYDGQGDVVLAQYYNFYAVDPTEPAASKQIAYKYDNHLPVEETVTIFGVYSIPIYRYNYTYDQGNVSKVDATEPDGTKSTTTFQYDSKPNLFKDVFLLAGNIAEAFSRNNRLKPRQELLYDSQGLLIQQNETYVNSPKFNSQYTYEYETY